MSLSDLASVGSFISGLAVLISLIFIYFQLRQVSAQVVQTERNQQASIRQGRAERVVGIAMARTNPFVADAVTKGLAGADDLSSTQLSQFSGFCVATMTSWEESFYQHREGLLNDAAFASFVSVTRSLLRYLGLRVFWKRMRGDYPNDFAAFMDMLLAETVVTDEADDLAQFRAEIAAEKSISA